MKVVSVFVSFPNVVEDLLSLAHESSCSSSFPHNEGLTLGLTEGDGLGESECDGDCDDE